MMTKILEKFHEKFSSIVTLFTGRNEVVTKVIFSVGCVKNSVHSGGSPILVRGVSHFDPGGVPLWSRGCPILVPGVSHFDPGGVPLWSGGVPFWSRGSPIWVRGSPILVWGSPILVQEVAHLGLGVSYFGLGGLPF